MFDDHVAAHDYVGVRRTHTQHPQGHGGRRCVRRLSHGKRVNHVAGRIVARARHRDPELSQRRDHLHAADSRGSEQAPRLLVRDDLRRGGAGRRAANDSRREVCCIF